MFLCYSSSVFFFFVFPCPILTGNLTSYISLRTRSRLDSETSRLPSSTNRGPSGLHSLTLLSGLGTWESSPPSGRDPDTKGPKRGWEEVGVGGPPFFRNPSPGFLVWVDLRCGTTVWRKTNEHDGFRDRFTGVRVLIRGEGPGQFISHLTQYPTGYSTGSPSTDVLPRTHSRQESTHPASWVSIREAQRVPPSTPSPPSLFFQFDTRLSDCGWGGHSAEDGVLMFLRLKKVKLDWKIHKDSSILLSCENKLPNNWTIMLKVYTSIYHTEIHSRMGTGVSVPDHLCLLFSGSPFHNHISPH